MNDPIDSNGDIDGVNDIDTTEPLHVDRRRFLQLGGASIAAAALLTACGDGDNNAGSDRPDDTQGEGEGGKAGDLRILRTAASVELAAVDVYQRALDSGLVTTPAAREALQHFQIHHRTHADLFDSEIRARSDERVENGDESEPQANQAVLQTLQGPLSQARDEAAVLAVLLQLENVAAATYVADVGTYEDASLNRTTMSVGGVEARHAAVIAALARQPQVPRAAFTTAGAVPAGAT